MVSQLSRIQVSPTTPQFGLGGTLFPTSDPATNTPNHAEDQTHFFCQDDFFMPGLVAEFDPLLGDLIRNNHSLRTRNRCPWEIFEME
jgi:hypothetical protein